MPKAILIGPPGAGKSTVGKALARKLNASFVDTDHLIEERAGRKISDIFVEDGEPTFRKIEEEVVLSALESDGDVIALGGGAVLSERTQAALAAFKDQTILLEVSLSQAAPRVGFNRDRPLLAVNPRQAWQALYEKREPIYKSLASFSVSTDSKKPVEVADEIAEYLGER